MRSEHQSKRVCARQSERERALKKQKNAHKIKKNVEEVNRIWIGDVYCALS